jgi:eukaryotic translation initiation factor 2C
MEGGGEEDRLPPPPPLPPGALPTKAPGYGGGGGEASGSGSGSGSIASHSGGGKKGMRVVAVPAKATRPDYGRAGRLTRLCVNYFRASLVKADDVYHYNVRLSPGGVGFGCFVGRVLGLSGGGF